MTDPGKVASAPYPGHTAKPREILALAEKYAEAAGRLRDLCRKGKPISQAPFRLAAIHAVELYLNAVLLAHGTCAEQIRGLQHDLSRRLAGAKDAGLKLDTRTANHIGKLSEAQEYLKARYAPNQIAGLSQLNRLDRTLEVVREQALALVNRNEAPVPAGKRRTGTS